MIIIILFAIRNKFSLLLKIEDNEFEGMNVLMENFDNYFENDDIAQLEMDISNNNKNNNDAKVDENELTLVS